MPVLSEQPSDRYDVIVIGTGLAGTAAGLAAWERGAKVLVVEKAPPESAGGNTRFSGGGFRIPRGDFKPEDLFEDVMLVSKGRSNKELIRHMTEHAKEATDWLQTHGLTFGDQSAFTHVGPRRVAAVWAQPVPFDIEGATQIGSGNGVVRQLHPGLFEKVDVVFETKAERLLVDDQRTITGLRTFHPERGYQDIGAGAVIIATGGFQANQEMRSRYWGPEAAHWRVRGTRFNTGDGIRMASDLGAGLVGDWTDLHCAVIDARTLPIEGGETNVNTYPYCIIVNTAGKRFVDEGEDFRDRTYAKFGRSILGQPGSVAFVVYDNKLVDEVICYVKSWKPTSADTLEELATKIGTDPAGLAATVAEYNAAIDRDTPFTTSGKDGRAARGITPEKSNWAVSIEEPPFHAFTVTGGVTFTMAGIRTNVQCEVISAEGNAMPGLYAAGEVQGDFFYYNYPGGSSLIRASVFGRAAGSSAAAYAVAHAATPA